MVLGTVPSAQAEKTFKFLEVCHRKLMTSYTRQTESVHQRTRREEEELKQVGERNNAIDQLRIAESRFCGQRPLTSIDHR